MFLGTTGKGTVLNKNLLNRLRPLASQQEENFFTESLAHFLCHLIEHEPDLASDLLSLLSGTKFAADEVRQLVPQIQTQVSGEEGTPDIEISTAQHLIYIEVKVDAGLGEKQLERYQKQLKKRSQGRTIQLATLSIYPLKIAEEIKGCVVERFWHQIATWIEDRLARVIDDPLNKYLAMQLLEFLRGRGIQVQKVNESIEDGLRAYHNLTAMIEEIACTVDRKASKVFGEIRFSFIVSVDDAKCFFGVNNNEPGIIWFEACDPRQQFGLLREKGFVLLKSDEKQWHGKDDRKDSVNVWRVPLGLKGCGFYELDRVEQVEMLRRFVDESIAAVREVMRGITSK